MSNSRFRYKILDLFLFYMDIGKPRNKQNEIDKGIASTIQGRGDSFIRRYSRCLRLYLSFQQSMGAYSHGGSSGSRSAEYLLAEFRRRFEFSVAQTVSIGNVVCVGIERHVACQGECLILEHHDVIVRIIVPQGLHVFGQDLFITQIGEIGELDQFTAIGDGLARGDEFDLGILDSPRHDFDADRVVTTLRILHHEGLGSEQFGGRGCAQTVWPTPKAKPTYSVLGSNSA